MAKQERAERTRLAILDAAAHEFDELGYEGARLERIVERTGATKGAVYFHFRSKLDIARALVDEKYTNWPVIVAEVTGTGLRGLAAAEELTQRVGRVFADDVRVRAAMKLTQTVLPPAPEDNPYARWTELVAVFVAQELEDRGLDGVDPREIAVVAVQAFFGAYMIGHELGRLDRLPGDVTRLWGIIGASLAVAQERPAAAG
ncbi:TetR/AcrR family transcriptional regulator [uncultured Leifsonia sp.]|uniref:TetR/AcrR family transcriptional regulator n=1 Tax=uncultured Leifsonia sp. TaxID=340359 RepID=UPI0028D2761A|nr:TetR/AcrR family transcriptional regulator [uncultured Leifsonia sp.]